MMKQRVSALILSVGLLLGMAAGPMAQPTQAASLKVCGEVTVYVKATLLGTGLITINGIPMIIGVGVSLPSSVAVGADLCLDLTTSLAGLITGAAVTANVHTHVKVCGTVTAYVEATATTTGLIKIGGHTFTTAIGSKLPASVDVGDDLCIDLEVDGFGRVADGTVTANAHVHLKVCGTVTAYAEATSTATGILKIGSHSWTLAVLSNLPASVEVGANLCIDLEIDGYGRVSDGEVSANVTTHVRICGTVTAYTAATASALGQLKIAGHTYVLALDTDLPASVDVGADLCMDLTINGFAQVKDGTAVANVTSTLDVCGQVTAYAAATSSTDGSLTHAGVVRKIAAGADVDAGVQANAWVKLRLVIDAFARVSRITVLKAGASFDEVCGSGPSATPTPAPTQGPGATQGPGQTQGPGFTQTPGSTTDPGASHGPGQSQAPGASQGPGASLNPGASEEPGASEAPGASQAPGASGVPGSSSSPSEPPTQGVGGTTDCTSGVGGNTTAALDDTLLPSTDAIGRATGVVASNAIPLLAIGLLGGLAAWYRARRRREEPVVADGPAIEDVPSHDGASGPRA